MNSKKKMRNAFKIIQSSIVVPEPPDVLYHYCSLSTFSKIIENKKLWLSHYEFVNDYLDMKWIHHKMDYELNLHQDKNEVEAFIRNYNLNIKDKYIACFSEDGDLLSQWRAYADDGCGIAIGFKSSELKIKNHFPHINEIDFEMNRIGLLKMNYDDRQQDLLVKETIYSITTENKPDFIASGGYLERFSMIFKNYKFQEEKEWRIVKVSSKDSPAKKYRIEKNQIIPYEEIDLSSIPNMGIVGLRIGPKSKIRLMHFAQYLEKEHIKWQDIDIQKSEATYK
jgi:Protein of unknown function (DUF2971).